MRSAIRSRRTRVVATRAGTEGVDRFPRQAVAQAFSATLRELRTARGLSQERLAEAAGLHMTYASMLERGLRTPTLTVIVRLSDALGVTPAYVVEQTVARLPLKPERITGEMDSDPDEPADASES